VLLDSTFASVPLILAEGRRVIANIERVAGLFVTKTAYAALIALAVGIAGIAYPFFPRHLTLISTFTIGLPGFFLALAPGAPLAHPGFTRRVLSFALPSGVTVAGAALGCYAIARNADGASVTVSRTAATLAVCAAGLWVLGLVARPLNATRILLLVVMAGGIALVPLLPLGRHVFTLEIPSARILLEGGCVVAAAIAALTLWRRLTPPRPRPSPP